MPYNGFANYDTWNILTNIDCNETTQREFHKLNKNSSNFKGEVIDLYERAVKSFNQRPDVDYNQVNWDEVINYVNY